MNEWRIAENHDQLYSLIMIILENSVMKNIGEYPNKYWGLSLI